MRIVLCLYAICVCITLCNQQKQNKTKLGYLNFGGAAPGPNAPTLINKEPYLLASFPFITFSTFFSFSETAVSQKKGNKKSQLTY